eukprot:jgi/Botrbrau1/18699/Bobra.0386s0025.1
MNTYRHRAIEDSSRLWKKNFKDFAKGHHLLHMRVSLLMGWGINLVLALRTSFPTWHSKVAAAFTFSGICALSIWLIVLKTQPAKPQNREELVETALAISLHVASVVLGPLDALTVKFTDGVVHAFLIFFLHTHVTQCLFGALTYTAAGFFWSLRILTALVFVLLTTNGADCQLLCHNHADLRQHLLDLRQTMLTWLPPQYVDVAPDAVGMCVLGRQTIQVGVGLMICIPIAVWQDWKDRQRFSNLRRISPYFTTWKKVLLHLLEVYSACLTTVGFLAPLLSAFPELADAPLFLTGGLSTSS